MAEKREQKGSILHIITRLDRGGSADVVLELAAALKSHGYRVGIVYGHTVDSRENPADYAVRTGVEMYSLETLMRPVSPLNDLSAVISLVGIIRRFKPDIVHTHTSKAGIIGRFAAKIAHVHRIVHTPHGHIFYGYFGAFTTAVFVVIERLAALITDRITVLTEGGATDHLDRGIGKRTQFLVIPSSVDIGRFSSGDRQKIRNELSWGERPVVGWAGRLVPIKDCATFIRAAAQIHAAFPDAGFIIAGDGEERKALEQIRDETGLYDHLVFLGERADIPDIMAAMDVFVLSSVNEGFGRVIVEAMAAGTAVVSTDVGGTSDVVEDGVSGILVPPSDHNAIAGAVSVLLDNAEMRNRLIENGKLRARRYDTSCVIRQFEELYGALLEK